MIRRSTTAIREDDQPSDPTPGQTSGPKQPTSLATKMILLVAVPILVQVVLIAAISWLSNSENKHAYDVGMARDVTMAIRMVSRNAVFLAESADDLVEKGTTSIFYQGAQKPLPDELARIRQWCDWLASSDSPEIGVRAASVRDLSERLVSLMQTYRLMLRGKAIGTAALKYRPAEIQKMIVTAEAAIQDNLESMQYLQKSYKPKFVLQPISEQPEVLFNCIVAGIVLNMVVLICLGFVFSRKIVHRLGIVEENVARIQRKSKLLPQIAGYDEIAHLDGSFREMAFLLEQEEEKERALFEHAYNMLCSIDVGRRFVEVNQTSIKVLGYKPEELVGKMVEDLVAPENRQDCTTILQKVVTADPQASFELAMVTKSGKPLDTLWTTSSTEDKGKVFCVLHDISERKAAQRIRKQMVQMVTQELRSPLTDLRSTYKTMKAAAKTVADLNERGERFLSAAETNSGRMLRLIDDLLDIENLEAGVLDLEQISTDLVPLLDQSIDSVLMLANQKQIALVNASAGTSMVASVDPHRIVQVLVNLLSNAIKFSPAGGTVTLRLEPDRAFVEIAVIDQGRGIPAHLLSDVFNRFQQVHRGDATEKGGSGLGLAICKSLIELHGGKISVLSELGKGSVFLIKLPV